MVFQHVLAELVAISPVGDVTGMGKGAPTLLLAPALRCRQLPGRARRQDDERPA
jgi:hypothetical protein